MQKIKFTNVVLVLTLQLIASKDKTCMDAQFIFVR